MINFICGILKKIFGDPFAGSELVHKFSIGQSDAFCITIESRKDSDGIFGIITTSAPRDVGKFALTHDSFKQIVNKIYELKQKNPGEFG